KASVTGSGVVICNRAATAANTDEDAGAIRLSGHAVVNLTAPTTGTYAGIVFFQPADNSRPISLSGDAVLQLNGGLVDAPAGLLSIAGNAKLLQGSLVVN